MTGPFEPGERTLLIDAKGRTYLVRLQTGEIFHMHGGTVAHDDILGGSEGAEIRSATGMVFHCFRPVLADFVLKMPRGAQVVYPKDLGPIVIYADIAPGARVLEAGTGSGSLTIALCRAVGPEGRVVSYDVRSDHQEQAARNIESFLGKVPDRLELRPGDLRDVGDTGERFDRAVLDLPNPWDMLEVLAAGLVPGGVVCAYLPTTVQVQQVVTSFGSTGFLHIETFETLHRSWHVTERSVRPDHRMVAHTGFVTIGRRLG